MEGINHLDYSAFGTFTVGHENYERADYVYETPKPSTRAETSCLDKVTSYAKLAFKIIFFPIFLIDYGIKRLISTLICQYQTFSVDPNYYTSNKEYIDRLLDGQAELHTLPLYPKGKDGAKLSAIKIIPNAQKDTPSKDRKWVVIVLPNAMVHEQDYANECFIHFAKLSGLCIAVTDYRGTVKDPKVPPNKFIDLVEDVDSLVKNLLSEGAQPRNILMQGLSLGGAVGAEVAARYQDEEKMPYLGENTFDSLQDLCLAFATNDILKANLEIVTNAWSLPSEFGESSIFSRMYFGAKEIVCSIPHMIVRIILFTTFFFESLYLGDREKALESIFEIGKTIVFDTLSLAAGIVTLTTSFFLDFTPTIRICNLALTEHLDDTMLYRILRSPLYTSMINSYLQSSGWTSNTSDAWENIKGKKLVSQVRKDEIIPFKTSLAGGIKNKKLDGEVLVHEFNYYDHCTSLIDIDAKKYFQFLEDALRIKFPANIHVGLSKMPI